MGVVREPSNLIIATGINVFLIAGILQEAIKMCVPGKRTNREVQIYSMLVMFCCKVFV